MKKYFVLAISVLCVLTLAACGGGGGSGSGSGNSTGDDAGDGGGTGSPSTLTAQSTLPVGHANCPYGGVKLDYGIDENKNGVLDVPSEVDGSEYICNGSDGANWWDALGTTGSITGKVTLESGVPAYGAMLSIAGTVHYSFADSFGEYSFTNVSVGHSDLIIQYSGYHEGRVERVPVTAGNTTTVRDVRLFKHREPLATTTSLYGMTTIDGKAAGDQSGYSVSSAGDVNGDGYDDILIGAPYANSGVNSDAGAANLVYGRPGMDLSMALSSAPDVTFTGNAVNDYSGRSVSGAGDVNGDGYDDILIGAPYADPGAKSMAGETYLIYGSSSLSGTISLSSADATFIGKAANDYSGASVSGAGDINGDGYDDILIGAYGADPGAKSMAGETYLIYGSSSLSGTKTLDSTDGDSVPSATFTGKAADDNSGDSVSGAGDVNGDGYDDILIGARLADPGAKSMAGETYLIYGSSSLSGTKTLDSTDGDSVPSATFTGKALSDYSGDSVSGAGDVNGDGYDDILISAPPADPGGNSAAGETYLIYGSASLISGTIALSSADATFTGKAASDYSGNSVSSAGDVNGDGFDDILIGAYAADPDGNSYAGETYLIYGGPSLSGTKALSDIGTTLAGATFTGKAAGDQSGLSVSDAGDVNGDGFDDILIGAFYADPGGNTNAGETYLVMGRERGEWTAHNSLSGIRNTATADITLKGKASGDESGYSVSSAGDVNGDGIDDILIGAYLADPDSITDSGETYLIYGRPGIDLSTALSFSPDVIFKGKATTDRSGRSVSGAGDVNGDGFDDILIGAFAANPNSITDAGETYLIYGSASLSGELTLDESDGDSVPDATFTGKAAGDVSGISVSSAGDVNGDGFDDILIGAYLADPNGTDSGETYLIYGSAALSGTKAFSNIGTTLAGATFTGKAAGDESGLSVSGAGDVNGDGFDDILIGAYQADPNGTDSGETYLIYGSASLSGTVALSSADATFTGKTASDYSGYSVSSAGDINGDGLDDMLIGAFGADPYAINASGETYLIYGSAALSGELTLDASDGDSVPDATFTGKAALDRSGYSVSSAGDINGDGFDDMLIGAYTAAPNGTDSGETYLIYGSASLSGTVALSSADATFTGKAGSDRSGRSVSGAGDVNGDGFDDVLIGAYWADPNGTDSGETYLFLGK